MNSTKDPDKILEWTAVYLGAVSCLLVPLFIRSSYFGLIELKARAYLYAAVPAVVLMAVPVLHGLFANGKKCGKTIILLAAIGVWTLISSLLSLNPVLSFLGSKGWSVGSFMTLILIAVTITVSRYLRLNPYMLLAVMAANAFINILAVIQSAGINIFGLQNGLIREQYYSYLSTIGNANSYSGYLCLVLPLFWGAFMSCREWSAKVLYGIFAVLGSMGIIMANSDSTYAGIGICLVFMLLFVFGSEQYLKRSAVLLSLHGFCLMFVRFCPLFEAKKATFGGLSKALIKSPAAELICLCGILLYLTCGKLFRSGKERYLMIALEALTASAIVLFAAHTLLNFNDVWGNGRGEIWRSGWEYFLELPLRQKITGIGPEMLFAAYARLKVETGRNVVTAHSDILQILLAQGLVGLGLYFAFWVRMVTLFFRKRLWKTNTAVFFFPLAAYWGQSLFCTVYPVTAVVFSIMTGLYIKNAESDL
ncbi:MAG: O-antigen ligase family protein [Lachnospiraceae bacterium]|nr:O-antigen ligase family protein [Lachnospiraceae bacterium]